MKLIYHEGNNFGDKLNPLIFDKLLPNFFDNNDDELFLGIGSILGLKQTYKQNKIIFSSGYASGDPRTYGEIPKIDNSYEILCVRGPLTAKILNIESKYAVADGALLIHEIIPEITTQKKSNIIYIPHHKSEDMYVEWEDLCSKAGIKYVSPKWDVNKILYEIMNAKLVITEAMHGAIVADTLRIPWVPVKAYPYINDFKWNDWASSLNLDISFTTLPSLHSDIFFRKIIKSKLGIIKVPEIGIDLFSDFIAKKRQEKFIVTLMELKDSKAYLSTEKILQSKIHQLYDILELFKKERKK